MLMQDLDRYIQNLETEVAGGRSIEYDRLMARARRARNLAFRAAFRGSSQGIRRGVIAIVRLFQDERRATAGGRLARPI